MTRDEWLAELAARLGVSVPSPETVEVLLSLAGTAAHRSERTAAPISCYLVGVAGIDPARAAEIAAEIAGDELA